MGKYKKFFLDGKVESFDGRIYTISLPSGETAILKHSTVHMSCSFPETMLSDGHLAEGTEIKLCRIVKDDKISILPDHRYYYAEDHEMSDSEKELAELIQEAAEAIKRLLKIIKNHKV